MDEDDRQQSIAAARGVLIQAVEDGVGIDDAIMERAAEAVHTAWLARHHHPDRAEDLRPYSDLTDGEKEKDREFARLAKEELTSVST